MNDFALRQQRTVDRIALSGSLLAVVAAAAFIALDPVQTVVRRAPAIPPRPATEQAISSTSAPVSSPLLRLALPSPAWTVVTDGRWVAYARLERGEPAEIVVRSLRSDDWRIAYRATPGRYLGQLSLAKGVLVFEEFARSALRDDLALVTVRALDVATGERRVLDEYQPLSVAYGEGGGYVSSSPVTDGTRVLWIHQALLPQGGVGNEIRLLDLSSGKSRVVFRKTATLSGLALSRDRSAFTMSTNLKSAAYTLDLESGDATEVDGFDFAAVQSIGPAGVVVSGGTKTASVASWLIRADGTRTRIASDCFNVTMNERVLAMRCATQIEVRDLAMGTSLYSLAAQAGAVAVYDNGVVWGEGDELVVYELPALTPAQQPRTD